MKTKAMQCLAKIALFDLQKHRHQIRKLIRSLLCSLLILKNLPKLIINYYLSHPEKEFSNKNDKTTVIFGQTNETRLF